MTDALADGALDAPLRGLGVTRGSKIQRGRVDIPVDAV
jgi:hypothetical protein